MTTQYAPIDQEILDIADSKIDRNTNRLATTKPQTPSWYEFQEELLMGIRLRQLVEGAY